MKAEPTSANITTKTIHQKILNVLKYTLLVLQIPKQNPYKYCKNVICGIWQTN